MCLTEEEYINQSEKALEEFLGKNPIKYPNGFKFHAWCVLNSEITNGKYFTNGIPKGRKYYLTNFIRVYRCMNINDGGTKYFSENIIDVLIK